MAIETQLHHDGTITYWSVYRQQWVHRSAAVPDRDLAAMSPAERSRVMRHLAGVNEKS